MESVEVEEMDTSDLIDKLPEAKARLREKALALLANKQFYKNSIKDLRISIAKGSVELSEDSENLVEKVSDLEAQVIQETSNFKTKELLLQFGQMSLTMNAKVGLDSSFNSSKQSDDENGAVIAQMERLYQLQTKYKKLDTELKELVEIRRKLQAESLDCIVQARIKYLELKKVKKQIKLDDEEAFTREEISLQNAVKHGVRVHTILSRVFEELIMCSQLDWYKDPQLMQRLIDLKKGLDLDK